MNPVPDSNLTPDEIKAAITATAEQWIVVTIKFCTDRCAKKGLTRYRIVGLSWIDGKPKIKKVLPESKTAEFPAHYPDPAYTARELELHKNYYFLDQLIKFGIMKANDKVI